MNVTETRLPGVLLIEAKRFHDERGYFLESWNERRYREAGIPGPFVQDNVSLSRKGVLRGLHYQREPHGQGKLVSVLRGEVFDVAVDLRAGSETFRQWVGVTLSAEDGRQLYIPEGFAHGFVVTREEAILAYKCTDVYHPETEETIRWDDPEIAIEWPVEQPILSEKDRQGKRMRDLPWERLAAHAPAHRVPGCPDRGAVH
jgi:dTDP-4-dehydrorhamnose 3,5-epimerase